MSFSDFKEVNINNPGTATSYGADDILEIAKILNGKVVSNRQVRVKNPWIWEDYFDVKAAAVTPGSPAANSKRIYVEPSNNHLMVKSTAGVLIDIDTLGGGTLTESSTSTFTNKTYNTNDNTLSATSQAAGDLLKNNGTKFVRMGKGTALQVLRTNAGATDLEWSTPTSGGDVFLGASNTHGDFDNIFRSGRVKIRNPANTFSYILTGSAITGDRTLTYPLLASNDTVVTESHSATLSSKTIVDPILSVTGSSLDIRRNTTGGYGLEFGGGHATGGNVYIDLHTDSGDGDYRTRIIRYSGANSDMDFIQTGTGKFTFNKAIDMNDSGVEDVQYLNMRSNDGSTQVPIFSRANTSPILDVHFFANYVKQVGATDSVIYYGYNGEWSATRFYSKWSGSNNELFTIDAKNTKNVSFQNLEMSDAKDIVLGTTTGTKIGTSTSQKIGFFNKTPVTQRTGISDVATDTVNATYGTEESNVITSLRTKVNAILQVLEDLGLTGVA